MKKSFLGSVSFHAAIVLAALVGIPSAKPFEVQPVEAAVRAGCDFGRQRVAGIAGPAGDRAVDGRFGRVVGVAVAILVEQHQDHVDARRAGVGHGQEQPASCVDGGTLHRSHDDAANVVAVEEDTVLAG